MPRKDPEKAKEYCREYHRKRREKPGYLESKREAERKRREDPEYRERMREYQRKLREDAEYRERMREYWHQRKDDPEHRERARLKTAEWRKANPEKEKAHCLAWAKANPERVKFHASKTYYANKRAYRAKDSLRRARELKATLNLPGIVQELRTVYENCPEGYEVDHIVPLINDLVCGLHVPWNLQYLLPFDNRSKGNKFNPDEHTTETQDRPDARVLSGLPLFHGW